MSRFEIVEAKSWHCGQIVRRLRWQHRSALAVLGVKSHHEIRHKFDDSAFRRAWLIDGQLAGLGGVTGPAIASEGMVWLALTDEAMDYPVAVAREARRQLDGLFVTKHRLFTFLASQDHDAMKFAMWLGFEVNNPTPIPVGNGHVLSVSYSRAALQAA